MSNWKTQIEPAEVLDVPHTVEESQLFRPMRRVAYPRITILDDGQVNEGEVIRVRTESLNVGRTEGDLVFPLESLMSSQHFRMILSRNESHQYWMLEDRNSRHGTYLRCEELILHPGMEFLAGGTRFRLNGPKRIRQNAPKDNIVFYEAPLENRSNVDQLEIYSYAINYAPALVPLDRRCFEVGRLTQQVLNADPFLEPLHFSMEKTSQGAWRVVDKKSHNGQWVRIQSTILTSPVQLTVGEQRLAIELPLY